MSMFVAKRRVFSASTKTLCGPAECRGHLTLTLRNDLPVLVTIVTSLRALNVDLGGGVGGSVNWAIEATKDVDALHCRRRGRGAMGGGTKGARALGSRRMSECVCVPLLIGGDCCIWSPRLLLMRCMKVYQSEGTMTGRGMEAVEGAGARGVGAGGEGSRDEWKLIIRAPWHVTARSQSSPSPSGNSKQTGSNPMSKSAGAL